MFITTIKKDIINPIHIVQVLINYEVRKTINEVPYIIFSDFYKVDNFVAEEGVKYCLCVMTDGSKHVCLLENVLRYAYSELPQLTNVGL